MEFLQYLLHQDLGILPRDQHMLIDAKGQPHKILLTGQLLQRNMLRALTDPVQILFFRLWHHRLFAVHQQIIAVRTAHSF